MPDTKKLNFSKKRFEGIEGLFALIESTAPRRFTLSLIGGLVVVCFF